MNYPLSSSLAVGPLARRPLSGTATRIFLVVLGAHAALAYPITGYVDETTSTISDTTTSTAVVSPDGWNNVASAGARPSHNFILPPVAEVMSKIIEDETLTQSYESPVTMDLPTTSSTDELTTTIDAQLIETSGSSDSSDPYIIAPSPSLVSATTFDVPALATVSISGLAISPHFGPGLVLPSTSWDVPTSTNPAVPATPTPSSTIAFEAAPAETSTLSPGQPLHADAAVPGGHSHRAPVIFYVILSLLVFSLVAFLILNTKCICEYLFSRMHSGLDSRVYQDLEKSSPVNESKETTNDGPQSTLAAWMKLPSQISPFHGHRDSLLSYLLPGKSSVASSSRPPLQKPRREASHEKQKVVDIVSDFPRSRFSVTSSDYTHSIRSVNSMVAVTEDTRRDHASLLSMAEFFSLPSSVTIASRHSRTGSAPVFGHQRREAGLSVALTRVKTLEREKTEKVGSNPVGVVQDRGIERRRTRSFAVTGNGRWF